MVTRLLFGGVSTAVFSPCRRYRYSLTRSWDMGLPPAVFVMLNPSTADAERNDPTITRCIRFAKEFGAGSLIVGNLFALRSTDPRELVKASDPVGTLNDCHLATMCRQTPLVVAAWGVNGRLLDRDQAVLAMLRVAGVAPMCLHRTKDGHPQHPLYVAAGTKLKELITHNKA